MPENNNNDNGGTGGGSDGGANDSKAFTPPASQADLDQIINARLARERAKFADYDDLKSKAAKFDEVEEANKTELQKALDKATKAEQEAAALKAEKELTALREQIAKDKEVPVELLRGSSKEEIEAHADSLKAFVDNKPAPRGVRARKEGRDTDPPNEDDLAEFARQIFS